MSSLASHLSPRRAAIACAAVAVVSVVVLGQVLGTGNRRIENVGLAAGIAVPFTILGALVLASIPRHPVGRLMIASGLTATVQLVALSWTDWTPLAWLAQWVWWPSLGLIGLAVLLFPDGRLPSRRWRWVAAVLLAGTAIGAILIAVAALDQPRMLTVYGSPVSPWAQHLISFFLPAALLTLAGYLGALGGLLRRWRHADPEMRRQLACLLPAGILMLIGLFLDSYGLNNSWALTAGAVPLGMAVAVLRYRLYDVDLIVNRTIVWLILTMLVLVSVAAIVRVLSDVVVSMTQTKAALVTTGLVVAGFEPVHRRVQHHVDHMIYGDRDDPYLVIARLGDVLRRTVDPTAVMPLVTGTIARSLQVPYVGVELESRDGPVMVTESGRSVTMTESFDMVSHGRRIGRLVVGRRSTGSRFSRPECRLLQDAAGQAAVAAEATQLNRDLQASRERLVTGREEERRRLRRDLHDGIGPSLAGLSMQAQAALRMVPEGSRAATILENLTVDLKTCTVEVRRLVEGLRPPSLDRGLEAALRAECRRFDTDALSVGCQVEGSLDDLPAAVEVATFRIVAEALTNVARHSGASACQVLVRRGVGLSAEVVDNGVGVSCSARGSVGLESMHERAAELGGTCTVTAADGAGTRVRLELPLAPAHRTTPSPASQQ
jgi:two-component system, NarL family, sensor kinase